MPRMELLLLLSLVVWLGACDAAFHDLRPEDTPPAPSGDTGAPDPDASTDGGRDVRSETDGEADTTTATSDADTSARPDADADGEPDTDTTDTNDVQGGRVVAEGQFRPRDYDGKGTVELYRLASGSWELRLGEDFQVDNTPGPVVILTTRETMGSDIKPQMGDKELGVLRSNSGADRYAIPDGPGDRRVAFIYCKPFGAEMLRAILEAP